MSATSYLKKFGSVGSTIVLSIVAIATPFWIVFSIDPRSAQGLYPRVRTHVEEVTSALNIVAIILMAASLCALIAIARVGSNNYVRYLPAALCGIAVSVIFILSGMTFYTIQYSGIIDSAGRFGYSFYLGWLSLPSAIGSFVTLCFVSD